jgi:hypothetical protein
VSDEELVIAKSGAERARVSTMPVAAAMFLIVGVVALNYFAALGVPFLALGAVIVVVFVRERRALEDPFAVLDRNGVRRARMGLLPPRSLSWPEVRRVRIARLGVRFEPHHGRPLPLNISSFDVDPAEILRVAGRYLPLGAVEDPLARPDAGRSEAVPPGPVVLRFRMPTMMRRVGLVVAGCMAIASLVVGWVVLGRDGEASITEVSAFVVLLSLATGVALALGHLTLRTSRIVIDEDGVSFRGLLSMGVARAYPWAEVRRVKRTFLPTRDPALELVVEHPPTGGRVLLPLGWTDISETDLIAAMRRLASPHTFEGPL